MTDVPVEPPSGPIDPTTPPTKPPTKPKGQRHDEAQENERPDQLDETA